MRAFIIFTIILLTITPSFAQRKKSRVSKQTVKSVQTPLVQQGYIDTEFDESTEQLPPKFLGHDIARLHDSIKNLPLRKSEFESTSEYNDRLQQLSKTRLFGSLNFGSTFAFSYTPNQSLSFDSLEADYDADKQILSVSIRSGYGSVVRDLDGKFSSSSDLQSLNIYTSSPRSLSSYIGTNAYGAKAKVIRGELDKYEVIFPNCVGTKSSSSLYGLDREEKTSLSTNNVLISVNVAPLEAVDLKYNIGVLVLGNLTSPYSQAERALFAKPTVKSPSEIWLQKRSVFLNIKSMWIYSRGTGKVYKKLSKCTLKPPSSSYDSLKDYYHYFF